MCAQPIFPTHLLTSPPHRLPNMNIAPSAEESMNHVVLVIQAGATTHLHLERPFGATEIRKIPSYVYSSRSDQIQYIEFSKSG